MTPTARQTRSYDGFAIPLQPDTNLGIAMLIAEDDDGNSQPINLASTISEARELAESDMRQRMRKLDCGEDGGFCPLRYKLWARGIDGDYVLAATIDV